MASFYEISVTPEPTILATKIATFQYSIRSFREPLDRSVRQVMIPGIQDSFDQEGPGWEPLADSTRRIKQKLGLNRGILRRTGALERSATRLARWNITSYMAYFGALPPNVRYGYPLDSGFINARTHTFVPAREFIKFDSDQRELVADIFDSWVDERIARHL